MAAAVSDPSARLRMENARMAADKINARIYDEEKKAFQRFFHRLPHFIYLHNHF